jgi:putative aldouronate transport system substrate-binding protein
MKRSFKFLCLLTALCMMLTMLAGCQSNAPAATSAVPAGATSAGAATQAPADTKAATGAATTLSIGITLDTTRDENPPGSGEYIDDNWATKYIIEKFAKPNNINLKFVIVDDTNDSYTQNYMLLTASKNAPDLMYFSPGEYGTVSSLAQSGALADLTSSLDKNGPDLKKFLTDDFIKTYGTISGKILTIPGKEDIPAISHYWIRTDWLKALNLPMPTNFDEWYTTMKAFKDRAAELQKAGCVKNAADVVPYAMYHVKYFTDWERIVTRFYPVKYFDSTNLDYYIYSGYGIEYQKEGFKEGLQFMNKMYQEGLISSNFALDSEEKNFERDIVSGNAGSYCTNLFSGWQPNDPNSYHNLVKQNIPGATFAWCDCFTNKYDNVLRNPLDDIVLTYSVVPSYSKSVDQAIMYLNFTSIADNMIKIQYGEEGTTYKMDSTLGPVRMGTDTDALMKSWGHQWGGRDLVMVGRLPNRDWSVEASAGAQTKDQAEEALKLCNGIEKNGYTRFPIVLNATAEKGTYDGALRTPWEKFLSSLIMAKSGEFDTTWTSGVAELESAGSVKLTEAYKRDMTKLGYTEK